MGKQLSIAGTERKVLKEVNAAAEHYVEQRDKRMKLTEKEKEAKDSLIDVMKRNDVTVYRDDDASPPLIVTLSSTDVVKVTKAGTDENSDE